MENPSQAALLTEIKTLERQVWDALISGDADADSALLSDCFLGVYSDGFASKSDHTGQLRNGPTIAHYTLDTFHIRALGPDHAMFSYRATFRRINRIAQEIMFITSVWKRKDDGWTNIFSQDTGSRSDP